MWTPRNLYWEDEGQWSVFCSLFRLTRDSSTLPGWDCGVLILFHYILLRGPLVSSLVIPLGSVLQFSSVQSLSRVRLFATPWIAARQASLSITNSRSSLRLVGYCTTYHGVCQNVNAVFFSSKSQGLDCPSLHVYYCCSRRSYWNELVSACSVAQSALSCTDCLWPHGL